MLDRVKGLHRREAAQLPEEVLLQIVLEQKGLSDKRVTRSTFSCTTMSVFPVLSRQQGITESRAIPRRLFLHVPLPLEDSRHRSHHDQGPMVTKSTAGHWSVMERAGWRSTGSKSDTEVIDPVSATFRVLPGPLFGSAGPEGVLEFQAIVFGQSMELSSIFRPSAHARRRRAAFTTCSDPRQRAPHLTVRIDACDQDAAPRHSANASLKALPEGVVGMPLTVS